MDELAEGMVSGWRALVKGIKAYDIKSVITADFKRKVVRLADVICCGHYEH